MEGCKMATGVVDICELLYWHRHSLQMSLLLLVLLVYGRQLLLPTLAVFLLYKAILERAFIYRAIKTLPRDFRGILLLIRLRIDILKKMREDKPLHIYFLQMVDAHPDKIALIDVKRDLAWTFTELNYMANRFANFFKQTDFKEGDVVAIYMENCPEFVAAWLGLSKIGIITAWINYNLRLQPLAHTIQTAKAKAILCSATLQPGINEAMEKELLSIEDHKIFVYGKATPNSRAVDLLREIHHCDTMEPTTPKNLNFKSVLCYIYTSGTTGMPKAAVMKHYRFYWIAKAGAESFGIYGTDRIYVTMPLYHTSAGMLGIGQTIVQGSTCVIREKFSASNFWKDCIRFNCTVSQYIGEICRYLLAQPESREEREHNVRVMCGNGLRPEIWPQFVARFGIARVGELYGSTEGTSNLVNTDNRVGACGFFPIYPLFRTVNPLRLVKVDPVSGCILRDRNGICIPCTPGETGEMVSLIKPKDPLFDFVGYVNKQETNKKLLRNVFRQGDEAFTSGDILTWDEYGYLYFKDRRGDSYRWKGENVSTTEVESILQPVMTLMDATVYGVSVPGMEGRAGMVAIARQQEAVSAHCQSFVADVGKRLSANLPSYAIPVFMRLCSHVDRTGTFKLQKTEYQKQGYDLSRCNGDLLFYWNTTSMAYEALTPELQALIDSGRYTKL